VNIGTELCGFRDPLTRIKLVYRHAIHAFCLMLVWKSEVFMVAHGEKPKVIRVMPDGELTPFGKYISKRKFYLKDGKFRS